MSVNIEQIKNLIENHIVTLQNEGVDIKNALNVTPPRLDSALDCLHKIKGSSGSIGFMAVAARADELHRYIEQLNWSEVDKIDAKGRALHQELDELLTTLSSKDSNLLAKMNLA